MPRSLEHNDLAAPRSHAQTHICSPLPMLCALFVQIACTYYLPALKNKTLTPKLHATVQQAFHDRFGEYCGWWVAPVI